MGTLQVGSSIQIALFVIPVIQLLAWTISKPMTLMFDRGFLSFTSSVATKRS